MPNRHSTHRCGGQRHAWVIVALGQRHPCTPAVWIGYPGAKIEPVTVTFGSTYTADNLKSAIAALRCGGYRHTWMVPAAAKPHGVACHAALGRGRLAPAPQLRSRPVCSWRGRSWRRQ